MQYIKLFDYDNIVVLQVYDTTKLGTNQRNRTVYTQPITVYQGMDNILTLNVRNQLQQSASMVGFDVQVDIQDNVNNVSIRSFGVEWTDRANGIGKVLLLREVIDTLDLRHYKLTFRKIEESTNYHLPLYSNDNFGVPIDLIVLDTYKNVQEPIPNVDDTVFDGGVIGDYGRTI